MSTALRMRSRHTPESPDTDESIDLARAAAHSTREKSVSWQIHLNNLSGSLLERFERTGDPQLLEESILAGRQAVASCPQGHPNLPKVLSNYSSALLCRYYDSGDLETLGLAVDAARRAVRASAADHPDLTRRRNNLATALLNVYERTREPAELAEAIELGRSVVAKTPDAHSNRAGRLGNLANLLRLWAEHHRDLSTVSEAVELARTAVAAVPANSPDRAKLLNNHAGALLLHHELAGDAESLVVSVEALRQAVDDTGQDHPDRVRYLNNLGQALFRWHHVSEDPGKLRESAELFETAATTSSGMPALRLTAARNWGTARAELAEWHSAVEGFELAISLIPQLVPRHLVQADQQYRLATMIPSLAADAAACALNLSDPERAVRLLEHGRGVLLAQSLDARTDLTLLRQEDPTLADRFSALRERLNAPENTAVPEPDDDFPAPDRASTWDRRRRAVTDWNDLITEIRAIAGLERFLTPPEFPELLDGTRDGPIALLNVSGYRADALILTPTLVDVVELPGLTPDSVLHQANRLTAATRALRDPARPWKQHQDAERTLHEILAWLWDHATGPVLDHVGFTDRPETHWPRVWWAPSGLLAFFPLHAAGHHLESSPARPRTTLDRVVSSYTPTVRVLHHARSRPTRPPADKRGLVVAMPRTVGASDLPGAQGEAASLANSLPVKVLTGAEATNNNVSSALPAHSWVHFACHGLSDRSNPSQSRLLLHDHQSDPLTVHQVSRLDLAAARLAYLSACLTSDTDPRLADEAAHITAAFQLAGYPQVIGTLWSLNDEIASEIADDVYSALRTGGEHGLDTGKSATALHHAIRKRRDSYRATPSLWAASIHAGT